MLKISWFHAYAKYEDFEAGYYSARAKYMERTK